VTNVSPVDCFAWLLNCCNICRQLQIQNVLVRSDGDDKKKEKEKKKEQEEQEKKKEVEKKKEQEE